MLLRNDTQLMNLAPEWRLASPLKDYKGNVIFDGDCLQLSTGEFVMMHFNGFAFQFIYADDEKLTLWDDEYKGLFMDLKGIKKV